MCDVVESDRQPTSSIKTVPPRALSTRSSKSPTGSLDLRMSPALVRKGVGFVRNPISTIAAAKSSATVVYRGQCIYTHIQRGMDGEREGERKSTDEKESLRLTILVSYMVA